VINNIVIYNIDSIIDCYSLHNE